MGWFDEQIKERKKHDNEAFEESFLQLADVVLGSRKAAALKDERIITKDAIDEMLKFYHLKSRDIPENITDINEQVDYALQPYGIMHRVVHLEGNWYKDAAGAMLAQKKGGGVVALIPTGFWGYTFFDAESGKRVRVNKNTASLFEKEAFCFYKPFPLKKLTIKDLLYYVAGTLSTADYLSVVAAAVFVTIVGMIMPRLNNILFSQVLESKNIQLLLAMMISMIFVTISSKMIDSIKTLLMGRINNKMDQSVESATMMRVLALSPEFFKQYGSGELSSRVGYMNSLCDMLISTLLNTGLTSIFSLLYITQIFHYAPGLVVPSMAVILVTILFSLLSSFYQMKITQKKMLLFTKESGMVYAIISGIQKIKLSGAEKRMFARWSNIYTQRAKLEYDPPAFIKLNTVITSAITLAGTWFLYGAAITTHVNVADYYAFNTAYAMVSGAFMELAGIALTVAQIRPILEMIRPVLESVPELSEGKVVVEKLSGSIELSHVSFRYNDSMPNVIDDLSLKIRSGQYVAIVGSTGCGKSTLMRLMLGFEKPQKGAIYYDGKDIENIELKSLRRKIGSVMQNGDLFSGDIFSNITIAAPQATLDDAWEAAALAGVADDIQRMPMGMHTLISEGQGGISGGQKQRLMIARALAAKPKILMFDEATSALDNLTQKKVSESLDELKCTRIVIAHRLSTIRHCDRIIVLNKGKIIEDGSYEELVAQNGYFAELVARQRLDI